MWQDPNLRYHFKIHHCEADDHYHFLIGVDMISWPFWSREAGRKLIEFSLGRTDVAFEAAGLAAGQDASFHIDEFEGLREEVERLPMQAEQLLLQERVIAQVWVDFLTENAPHVCYRALTPEGVHLVPLVCDFVQRQGVDSYQGLSSTDLDRIAQMPVSRVRMEELGIMFDPA